MLGGAGATLRGGKRAALFVDPAKDASWMYAFRDAYFESCRALIMDATPEDLEGIVVSPVMHDESAKSWPDKVKIVSKVMPYSDAKVKDASEWMKIMLKDKEFSGTDRAAIEDAVRILKVWRASHLPQK